MGKTSKAKSSGSLDDECSEPSWDTSSDARSSPRETPRSSRMRQGGSAMARERVSSSRHSRKAGSRRRNAAIQRSTEQVANFIRVIVKIGFLLGLGFLILGETYSEHKFLSPSPQRPLTNTTDSPYRPPPYSPPDTSHSQQQHAPEKAPPSLFNHAVDDGRGVSEGQAAPPGGHMTADLTGGKKDAVRIDPEQAPVPKLESTVNTEQRKVDSESAFTHKVPSQHTDTIAQVPISREVPVAEVDLKPGKPAALEAAGPQADSKDSGLDGGSRISKVAGVSSSSILENPTADINRAASMGEPPKAATKPEAVPLTAAAENSMSGSAEDEAEAKVLAQENKETDNKELEGNADDNKFRGVPLGIVHGQNVTRTSYMLFRIIATYSIKSMADMPCHSNVHWMPQLLERLDYEVLGFKYYGVDTTEKHLAQCRQVIKEYGNPEFRMVQPARKDKLPEADLVFSWEGIQTWGIRPAWLFFKNLRHSNIKYALFMNNPGINNLKHQGRGVVNVRRPPFHFAEAVKVISNISVEDDKPMQILLYDIDSIRPGII